MSIVTIMSNQEFLEIYGDHPHVACFDREQQNIILNKLSVQQQNSESLTDVTWKEIFIKSAVIDKEILLDMSESYLDCYTHEVIQQGKRIDSEKVAELLKVLPDLENEQLLAKYLSLLDEEPEFIEKVCDIIAKYGRQTRLHDGRYLSTTTSTPDEDE